MAGLALALMVFFLVLAFGVRVAVALLTTGSSGISSLRGAPAAQLLGGGMFALATALGAVNPALVLADAIEVWDELDTIAAHVVGTLLCLIGILGTFVAQMEMGSSWRIGVDPSERTELVTSGVFASMRNPVYTFMIVAWTGGRSGASLGGGGRPRAATIGARLTGQSAESGDRCSEAGFARRRG